MSAVMILLGEEPTWSSVRKVMNKSNFIQMLINFDKDNVPKKTLNIIEKYVSDPKFSPEMTKNVSKAAYTMCNWVLAISNYSKIAKPVGSQNIKEESITIKTEEDVEVLVIDKKVISKPKSAKKRTVPKKVV